MSTHIYICTYIYIYMNLHTPLCIYTYLYMYLHTIYINIYTYILTFDCAYTCSRIRWVTPTASRYA